MKYNTFMFRDLDNQYVIAQKNNTTNNIDLDVIQNGIVPAHELALNQVEIVEVSENQEDVIDIKHITRIEVISNTNNPINLAELAETDDNAFWQIVDKLYNVAQDA